MKDFKVKAWDFKNKVMYWVITDVHWMVCSKISSCRWCTSEIDDGTLWNDGGTVGGEDTFELMLYVGQEDKNKKPIYEEDIIKLSCGCCFYRIEYDPEKAAFIPISDGRSQVHGEDIDIWEHELEVIGNTKEHPDLWDEIRKVS